ncbi:P-loop containing nucleoside triphosphate hydrolase protein [Glomus cerebriforme]|uniref:P-loop containing nucleoside triphosphate hydrolase protein n=1 Tax=Glomus cerebriforme TaxID=658196 RepID=A0A397SJI6_9GLOM|nr:P-loop containing nucleoside triphosphate hydrolase protein [Glomus cerebriforme]
MTIINIVSILNDLHPEYTRTAKPCIWCPRTWCLKSNLHPNTIISLISESKGTKCFAFVKLYSKFSELFRDKKEFPENLEFSLPAVKTGNNNIFNPDDDGEIQVVISRLLAFNLGICEISKNISNLKLPIQLKFGELVKNIPIATRVILYSFSSSHSLIKSENSFMNNDLEESIFRRIHLGTVVLPNDWIYYNGSYFKIIQTYSSDISQTEPSSNIEFVKSKIARISENTVIEFSNQQVGGFNILNKINLKFQDKSQWIDKVTKKIGGLDEVISEIIEQIHLFIITAMSDKYRKGIKKSKGIILTGKPGTGKTALALCLAESSGLPFTFINCPDIFKTDEGEGENELCSIFESMMHYCVSIIILDEIDIISDKIASVRTGAESKLYSMLIRLIDSINENVLHDSNKGQIFIIGLTNRLHAVNNNLYRPGRLDRVYEFNIKKPEQRLQILKIITKKIPFVIEEKDLILEKVSRMTHGFVATDLQHLCSNVAMELIQKISSETINENRSFATLKHFENALKVAKPSDLNEYQTKIPDIKFSDIFGINNIIEDLKLTIIEPFNNSQEFLQFGISPPRGILIYGPSGVGKTMLCCAIAAEIGINFMLVEGSQVISKIVGESENNIARIFAQAKANSPCVLFIDQIDVLAPIRGSNMTSENTGERVVTSLLVEMDGFFTSKHGKGPEVDVLVIAATNRPEIIDSALLRPGRLDQHIYISPPNLKQRKEILIGKFQQIPTLLSEDQINILVNDTEGFSGADLDNLCREAALISIRENINNKVVTFDHFTKAESICKASLLNYKSIHPFDGSV